MSKFASPSAFALVDGYNLLGHKPQTMMLEIESLTEQNDGLGDANDTHAPVGKSKSAFSQGGGFFDTVANSLHDAMASQLPTSPQATPRVLCIGCMGLTVGAVFYGWSGIFSTAYKVMLQLSKLTKAEATYAVDGALERGQIVQPLATKTADWNTKTLGTTVDFATDPSQVPIAIVSNTQANPTIVTTAVPHGLTTGQVVLISGVTGSNADINGQRTVTVLSPTTFSVAVDATTAGGTGGSFVLCSTVNGGAGYQQITALAGFSGFVGKIRHSADDTTYADLVTFANVTVAPGKERKTAAGTVNRFLCFDGDVTGSGSITAFAGFVRS